LGVGRGLDSDFGAVWRRAVALCAMPTLAAKCAAKMGHPVVGWGCG